MTIEELKQRLEGIRWIDKEISQLYLELQYLETGLFKQTRLTQTRVQTSRGNSSEHQLVAQLTLKEDITNRINRLTKERMELVSLIDSLKTPKHRLALNLYYVQQKLDIEAGEAMGVSRQTFFRYLRKALSELAEVLDHAESDHEKGLRLPQATQSHENKANQATSYPVREIGTRPMRRYYQNTLGNSKIQ